MAGKSHQIETIAGKFAVKRRAINPLRMNCANEISWERISV
jgi:hypothetical protein